MTSNCRSNRDIHLQHFKSYSKLFAATFKESIHHLRHLKFLELLKSADPDVNYEDVSYDVESLFTSIPVAETI